MRTSVIGYAALGLLLQMSSSISAQNSSAFNEELFEFKASYIGDFLNNISGGVKRGSCYLGMANINVSFSTGETGFWKGGQFFINAANTHGALPSGKLIGDFQVASNIQAGNHTYIQELWYKQTFRALELTAGLQNLNNDFVNTDHGALYLNSSFGILPTISGNIPAPIFPLTSLGLSVKWQISEKTTLLTALFDGRPTGFEHNPYNLSWKFSSTDGVLAISEIQVSSQIFNLPGTYKAGIYSHYHLFEHNNSKDAGTDSICKNNYGFYVIADQTIWHREGTNEKLAAFVQFGLSPEIVNQNSYYTGFGFNFYGLFNKRGNDILGIAVAHDGMKKNICDETTIELSYKALFTKNIFVQPDFQYIINPAGYCEKLDNSLVFTLRFGINF